MENLGGMACSRYTRFREITDRDVLGPHCIQSLTARLDSQSVACLTTDLGVASSNPNLVTYFQAD